MSRTKTAELYSLFFYPPNQLFSKSCYSWHSWMWVTLTDGNFHIYCPLLSEASLDVFRLFPGRQISLGLAEHPFPPDGSELQGTPKWVSCPVPVWAETNFGEHQSQKGAVIDVLFRHLQSDLSLSFPPCAPVSGHKFQLCFGHISGEVWSSSDSAGLHQYMNIPVVWLLHGKDLYYFSVWKAFCWQMLRGSLVSCLHIYIP